MHGPRRSFDVPAVTAECWGGYLDYRLGQMPAMCSQVSVSQCCSHPCPRPSPHRRKSHRRSPNPQERREAGSVSQPCRHRSFCRQRIPALRFTRSKACGGEAADGFAAFVEVVHGADILAVPALDRAADGAADEGEVLGQRIIAPALSDGADVVDVAASAGEVLREGEVETAGWVLTIVAGILDQRVADRGGDCCYRPLRKRRAVRSSRGRRYPRR